jgi:hypothetical protein
MCRHADERTYMNMWLFESAAPTDTNAVEMILQDFIFTAMAATGRWSRMSLATIR